MRRFVLFVIVCLCLAFGHQFCLRDTAAQVPSVVIVHKLQAPEGHRDAALIDNEDHGVRTGSSRTQRYNSTPFSKWKRPFGKWNYVYSYKFNPFIVYGGRWLPLSLSTCIAVSREYYVFALRHILC